MKQLTPAEQIAAELQAEGLTGKEIAWRLGKKYLTIRAQLASARRKLGAWNAVTLANAVRQAKAAAE